MFHSLAEIHGDSKQHRFLFNFFFLMWIIFKVFIEFATILLLFYVLVFWFQGMRDVSSSTRDRTHTPCIGRRSLNHSSAREAPEQHKGCTSPT